MKTISNTRELHAHLQEVISRPTEELERHLVAFQPPEIPEANPRFCVEAMWADSLNVPENVRAVMWAEIHSRKHPDRDDLKVRFINF